MSRPGLALLVPALAALCSLSCAHTIKNISPEDRSRLSDNEVRFDWEDDCKVLPWSDYNLELALDQKFENQPKRFKTDRAVATVDVVDAFGPSQRMVIFWRVRARLGGIFWTGWSDTYSFTYEGKAKQVKQPVVFEQPPPVEAPPFLVFGTADAVVKEKTYSLTPRSEREIAVKYLALKLWDKSRFRMVERDNLVDLQHPDDNVPPPRESYLLVDDRLNDVNSLSEVLAWRLPDDYLVVDYYKQVSGQFLMFARLVDARSGVVVWHHLESVAKDRETAETFGALLTPTCVAMAAAIGDGKSIVLAEVTENGKASGSLKELALPFLLKHKSFALLLRNPPVTVPVMVERRQPNGEVQVLAKTYYKLYEKQFSVIAKSAQQLWPEADENIAIEYRDETPRLDRTLISNGTFSDEQIDLFWRQPRKSMTATIVDTRTGLFRGRVIVVARDDVAWSALSLKLAEVLTR